MNITSTLADLVSFPSVSNDLLGGEACFRYLRQRLNKYDLDFSLLRSHDFPSIVATTQPKLHTKVLLQAHLDVVPGRPALFKLVKSDGRLYGRGVYDMKFAVACYLQLVEDLKDELANYDFGLMLTCDEEVGGKNGVKYLLEKGYKADVCILPDGGDNWAIEASCNGVWIAKLVAQGRSAHGSRPWEGDNAIDKLSQGLDEMRTLFKHPDSEHNSLTVTMIKGGAALNQVPDYAEAHLDARFVSQTESKRLRGQVQDIAERLGLELETIESVECINTDITHPAVAEFLRVASRIHGGEILTTHSFGSSDARYFNKHGIPTILMRPDGGGAHSEHEWIDEASLLEFYEVLKAYVTSYAKIS